VEQQLLREPVQMEWELEKSPAGANQFRAKGAAATIRMLRPVEASYADHAGHGRRCGWIRPTRRSPAASWSIRISSRTRLPARGSNSPTATWARARYLGPEVPAEELIWRDPVPPPITS
jgi:catalase-peroxidase